MIVVEGHEGSDVSVGVQRVRVGVIGWSHVHRTVGARVCASGAHPGTRARPQRNKEQVCKSVATPRFLQEQDEERAPGRDRVRVGFGRSSDGCAVGARRFAGARRAHLESEREREQERERSGVVAGDRVRPSRALDDVSRKHPRNAKRFSADRRSERDLPVSAAEAVV